MTEIRILPPAHGKTIGYACPRCRTRLLRDYDDLTCYMCGYRTAIPDEVLTASEPLPKAA
jgi:hypothetical protein